LKLFFYPERVTLTPKSPTVAAIKEDRLFAYQQQFTDKLGPNFVMRLLGSWGYVTTDPKNVEAVLSTRFEGA